jgi:predicted nucleic acid-binding Zn ribbon protein
MPDTPASGADLARQVLAAARAAAKTAPAAGPKQRRPKTIRRGGSGRDPVGLGAALQHIATEQGWNTGISGGNVIDQWATLCPQYADTVQPVTYDADRGRLDLRPSTYAYASQLRLLGGQLAKQINDKLGSTVVRSIRVLPVGAITVDARPAAASEPAAPEAPVRTRETASAGYRRTLEAHQAAKADGEPTNPHVVDAIERQDRMLADLRNREPETAFTDAVAELERLTAPPVDRAEQIRRAAIARKRGGGGAAPVRRAFDVA